jgi:AAA domain
VVRVTDDDEIGEALGRMMRGEPPPTARLRAPPDEPSDSEYADSLAVLEPSEDLPTAGRPSPNGHKTAPLLHMVSLEEFAATPEDGTAALLGDDDQALIAEDSDVLMYGDGGAGKTTLAIDLAIHWAAGQDWLGIHVAAPVTSLIIENEGPRPRMRKKLDRKLTSWTGSAPQGRAGIIDKPWAEFILTSEDCRAQLGNLIKSHSIDVVIIGPLVCAGMTSAGTLNEVREFLRLIADVRRRAGRCVTFVLVHHQNRAGSVSGAWEGAVDTLLHVTGMGHGRTRLHIQKSRWASDYHARTFELAWIGNDGYRVEDKPKLSDDDIAEQMTAFVSENPGTGWSRIEQAIPGVRSAQRRAVRDRLLTTGRLVNIGKQNGADVWLTECPERKVARLYLADDPTIRHLRPDPDAAGTQTASA